MIGETHDRRSNRQSPIEPVCRRARPYQGQAFGGREERPVLTRPARAGAGILRSGRGKACGAVELEKWAEGKKVAPDWQVCACAYRRD